MCAVDDGGAGAGAGGAGGQGGAHKEWLAIMDAAVKELGDMVLVTSRQASSPALSRCIGCVWSRRFGGPGPSGTIVEGYVEHSGMPFHDRPLA